ncbi:hypothetical protein [Paenibacillus lycopersici]|nr:hypothetical protein [Paenibacillus lycopersici]
MYEFILTQWIMRKIDAAKVISYAPKWITVEQAETILATPQIAD